MNIRQLQYFVRVAERRSFSQAAADLFTSRQNVRQAIKSLESELGRKLFESSGNKLELTSFGEKFAKRAEETVRSFEDLERDYLFLGGTERALKFAVDISYASNGSSFFEALQRYGKSANGCETFVSEGSSEACFDAVFHGEADISLIMSMDREFPECETIELLRYPIGLLVSDNNALAKKRYVGPSDLRGQRLLAPIGFSFQYRKLMQECMSAGFTLSPAHVINDGNEAIDSVRNNYGVMLTDAKEDETASSKGMRVLSFENEEMTLGIHLLYRKDSSRKKQICDFAVFLSEDTHWRKHSSSTGYDRWKNH